MDFIDKDNDAFAVHAAAIRLLHDRTDVLDPARHRREIDEFCLRLRCDDLGKRRLSDTGRSPEDHGGDMVAFDETAQHLSLAEKMFLPDKFRERPWTNTLRERLICSTFKESALFVHQHRTSSPYAYSLTMDYRIKKRLRQFLFSHPHKKTGLPHESFSVRRSRFGLSRLSIRLYLAHVLEGDGHGVLIG